MKEDSPPLPIKQLSAPPSSRLKSPQSYTPTHYPRNCSLFTLPPELRAKIYRHILISRLDCNRNPRLWRPLGVDGETSRIGYFARETVMPLLLACRQIHEEAAAILYGENTFAFHVSGLALDGKIAFLESLSEKYVALLKRVYIRTGYGVDSYGCRSALPEFQFGDVRPTLEEVRRKTDCDLATSRALLREAWPSRYRVEVDGDVTVKEEGDDDVGLLREQKVVDWPAGAFHLWKMFVVEGRDGEMRREFRRVEWKGTGRKGGGPILKGIV